MKAESRCRICGRPIAFGARYCGGARCLEEDKDDPRDAGSPA